MLFTKQWKNYCTFVGLWGFNEILKRYLDSLNPSQMMHAGPPTEIVQNLSLVATVGMAVYLAVYLAKTTNESLGPKLVKTRKNLATYGIKSVGTLALVLGDLATIWITEQNFYYSVFHWNNAISPIQGFFITGSFPILGLFLIWRLGQLKVEYEEPSSINA